MTGTPYRDQALSYRLSGDLTEAFSIDSSTGQIRVKTGATLDYETASRYEGKVEFAVQDQPAAVHLTIFVREAPPPTVTIADAVANEGDAITFAVTLDQAVSGGLTVTPSFTDGTATEGTDYTENTAGLTFTGTKGETQTFTVATTEDTDEETDETFTVGLAVSGTTETVTATDTATGTITDDDDDGVPTLTVADASANEGDAITFTVTLDQAVSGGLTVTPSFEDGTATEGTDYTENTSALSFTGTAGEQKTFTVATTQDADPEANETFTVNLAVSGTSETVTATDTATGTIVNDDLPAVVISGPSGYQFGAFDVTITFSESMTGFEQGDVTVGNGKVTAFSGSGASYRATITPAATGPVTVNVAANAAMGEDSRGNHAANQYSVIADLIWKIELPSALSAVTEGDAASVEVKLLGSYTEVPAPEDLTFYWWTSDEQSATADSDFPAQTRTSATIPSGKTSVTLEARTLEDDVVEGVEFFRIRFAGSDDLPANVTTGSNLQQGYDIGINDDDSAAVTIEDASAGEGDALTFTVTLDTAVQGGLTVTPGFTDGTATEGTDYTENTAGLTFTGTKGETQSFTVATTEDTDEEEDETFAVSLSVSDAPATVTATDTATGTITNDDGNGEPTVTIDDASANEGDSITFTVTLDEAVAGGLTVTPSFTDGTATKSTDYTENTAALSFTGNAGETQSFTVATTEDTDEETNETFTVSLAVSGTSAEVTASDTATGTITNDDDDGVPTVTIEDASAAEGDAITFKVTLDQTVSGGLTVTPSFTNGTAASTDYVANTAGISFAGTAGETQTFTVSTVEDEVVELGETFTVSLAVSGTSETVTATDTASGTITNDDTATVTVGAVSGAEGGSGYSFTVNGNLYTEVAATATLDKAVQGGFQLYLAASSGTATAGTNANFSTTDFGAALVSLHFAGNAGEQQSLDRNWVSIHQDEVVEGTETFNIAYHLGPLPGEGPVLPPVPASVTVSGPATGSILDDDSAAVTIEDASAAEGDALTFTVTLDTAVQGGLTVAPGFTDGTATEGTDYTENTAGISFTGTEGETQTFTVATTEDSDEEEDETFTVNLSVSDAPATVTATDTATGTITDDDNDGVPTVTVADASASEGDAITFTVTLDQAVSGGLTVTPSFTNGTAESTDYTANTAALTFTGTADETQTFTVSTVEDEVVELDETFTVSLAVSGTSETVTATDTASGTITNDDTATVTVGAVSGTEGGSVAATATLDKAVEGGFQLHLTATGGTATIDPDGSNFSTTDFGAAPVALQFTGNAGEQQSLDRNWVSIHQDEVVEGTETFNIAYQLGPLPGEGSVLPPVPASVTVSGPATGSILDDDSAAVTIEDASAAEGDALTFTVTLDTAVQSGLT